MEEMSESNPPITRNITFQFNNYNFNMFLSIQNSEHSNDQNKVLNIPGFTVADLSLITCHEDKNHCISCITLGRLSLPDNNRSASSSTRYLTRARLRVELFLMWSASRPGVATTT